MFKLEFTTSNAAFDDDNDGFATGEINSILTNIGHLVCNGRTDGPVFDSNGNRVGSWSYTQD